MLGSTLIFTCFSFYARCAATLTVVSARDSGMVFAQPPQRNSQQTFLSLGAEMKSYSFLHSLYKFFDLIISPKHLAVNLFCNLTLKRTRSAGLLRLLRRFVFSRHTSNATVRLIQLSFRSESNIFFIRMKEHPDVPFVTVVYTTAFFYAKMGIVHTDPPW